MDNKDILRKEFRQRLAALSPVQRSALSAAIRSVLSSWPPFKSARTLVAFHPMKGEPDFISLIVKQISAGHQVGLVRTPAINESELLEVKLWDGSDASLEKHRRMPLLQPQNRLPSLDPESWKHRIVDNLESGNELLAASAGIVLVPGLAFGRDGSRLGQGAGWYDRFLKIHPGLLRVGIGFGQQIRDTLPQEEWDQALDFIVCEEGVQMCSR